MLRRQSSNPSSSLSRRGEDGDASRIFFSARAGVVPVPRCGRRRRRRRDVPSRCSRVFECLPRVSFLYGLLQRRANRIYDELARTQNAQVQSIKRTTKTTSSVSSVKCSAASTSEEEFSFSRRQAVLSTAAGAVSLTQGVNPSYALSGFNVVKESREGYQFIYPVGWQEISVDGQAKVYKDIIEPLESISLNIYPTERESLKDIGTAQEVAETLVKQALSAPGALGKLLNVKERTDKDGHLYYSFEFVSATKSYERHALTTVTITQGKFFTLTTGSSERRWNKMKDRLNAANDSFQVYY